MTVGYFLQNMCGNLKPVLGTVILCIQKDTKYNFFNVKNNTTTVRLLIFIKFMK